MITEDYVSFEVAKLLKEKGFDGEVRAWHNYFATNTVEFDLGEAPHAMTPAPTLQMAMKWLREIHHIDICVCRELDEQGKCFNGYIAVVCQDDCYKVTIRETTKDLTYEEAANKAIKYSLTLI